MDNMTVTIPYKKFIVAFTGCGKRGKIMSSSSLWVMDKDYNGQEVVEFQNSWLFSPIIWDVLLDKYLRNEIQTPYGYKKSIVTDIRLHPVLNEKVNNCGCMPDRVCWELSNQQVFFTKDKHVVASAIRKFVHMNNNYDRTKDGRYPLKAENIVARFNAIADEIEKTDENVSPYFIFKNTSCDDNVENWFSKYDEETEESIDRSLKDVDKRVTEFVVIENSKIVNFIGNLDYFNITGK